MALILLALGLSAIVIFDLVRTLRSGRARGKFGTITLKTQPDRYWRYVYWDYAVLGLCAVMIIWAFVSR
jgi:hypothetical protein